MEKSYFRKAEKDLKRKNQTDSAAERRASQKYKILSLLLAVFTVASALSSCSGGKSDETSVATVGDETAGAGEETHENVYIHSANPDNPIWAEAYLRSLPERDFNGATFFLAVEDSTLFDPDGAVYLSDTVTARNRAVEEKYNITIAMEKVSADTMREELANSELSGLNFANICCIPMSKVSDFVLEDRLMNLRSLPALDMDAPYFYSSSVEALSAGYKTYGIAGHATPSLSDASAVFFNKNLLDSVGGGDIFDLAESGAFTWDSFYEYASLASSLEGVVPAASMGGSTAEAVLTSLGGNIVASGVLTVPSVGFTPEALEKASSYMRSMVKNGEEAGISNDVGSSFSGGGVLFTVGSLRDISSLSSPSLSFGVLPMPKAAAEDSYRSLVDGGALIMTVPKGNTDAEMVSLVLSALNAASYGYLAEKYVDYLLVTELSNSRSADMLDIIAGSLVYDFSSAFSASHPDMAAGTTGLIRSVTERGDYAGYDSLVYSANHDMAVSFPLSN